MEAIVGGTVAFQGAKLRWISERDEEGVELWRISGKDRRRKEEREKQAEPATEGLAVVTGYHDLKKVSCLGWVHSAWITGSRWKVQQFGPKKTTLLAGNPMDFGKERIVHEGMRVRSSAKRVGFAAN